jgi:uncharacterized protein YndB with AHSA1/START domain
VSSPATPFDPYDATRDAVRAAIEIAAPPEHVFEALTDPAQLAAWWGTDATHRARDWHADVQPGGRWHARTTDAAGREGSLSGEYRVVDPPRVLEHTWEASWDETPTVVRYELAPARVGGVSGTRVTVTHTGFDGVTGLALGGGAGASMDTIERVVESVTEPAIGIAARRALATRVVPAQLQRALALAI